MRRDAQQRLRAIKDEAEDGASNHGTLQSYENSTPYRFVGKVVRHLCDLLPVLPATSSVRVIRPRVDRANEEFEGLHAFCATSGALLRRTVLHVSPHRQ